MADTNIEAKVLWSGTLPGGTLIVRFEPEGYVAPAPGAGIDRDGLAAIVGGALENYLGDALEAAIVDAANCVADTASSAMDAAAEAASYAETAKEYADEAYSKLRYPDLSEIVENTLKALGKHQDTIIDEALTNLAERPAKAEAPTEARYPTTTPSE